MLLSSVRLPSFFSSLFFCFVSFSLLNKIQGTILADEDTGVMIGVQQIMNLSDDPNRETLWNMEVVDMANKFYLA